MSKGTILAHKHTLCEAFAGFFRALVTERFSEVREWLHPELEQLVLKQCEKSGEKSFLRSLRHGLGSATQRLRLGQSQAEGARQIRTELITPTGQQAGSVRFVLSSDGWRIYAVEVWTDSSASRPPRVEAKTPPAKPAPLDIRRQPEPNPAHKRSILPKIQPQKWLATIYASR